MVDAGNSGGGGDQGGGSYMGSDGSNLGGVLPEGFYNGLGESIRNSSGGGERTYSVSVTVYNYNNANGSSAFETSDFHGFVSYAEGGTYFYDGTSTHNRSLNIDFEGQDGFNASHYNPFETGAIIDGALGLSLDGTIHGTIGAQKLANALAGTSHAITDIGKLKIASVGNIGKLTAEGAGKIVAGFGVALTLYDIHNKGLNWSNGMDLVMEGVGFIPVVGWAISGGYFLTNMIVESTTGELIGEHLGDALQSH